MNKKTKEEQKQELRGLSRKYFWEQKVTEVSMFILIILGFIASLYISSSIFLMVEPIGLCVDGYTCTDSIILTGLAGLSVCLIIIIFVGLILWVVYDIMKNWIQSNQNKARRKAQKELGMEINDYDY